MSTQPIPRVATADVERIVRRDFPEDQVDAVLAMLREYGTESWHREADRVRLAILKLANGSVERLQREIAMAKTDYRDVLAPAEYPIYCQRTLGPDKLLPEAQQRLFEDDWRQYQEWFGRT